MPPYRPLQAAAPLPLSAPAATDQSGSSEFRPDAPHRRRGSSRSRNRRGRPPAHSWFSARLTWLCPVQVAMARTISYGYTAYLFESYSMPDALIHLPWERDAAGYELLPAVEAQPNETLLGNSARPPRIIPR